MFFYSSLVIKCPQIFQELGEGIKENDGEGEFNYNIVRTFVNVTMYPRYNNNKKT
jgi:hypothetical protein